MRRLCAALACAAIGAVTAAGCASRSDNPRFGCTPGATPSGCTAGEICYRGFCIPAGGDAGPGDAGCFGGGVACLTSMAGVCALGMTVCLPTGGSRCERDVDPTPEICDRDDDDCDGAVDEGAEPPCFAGASGCMRDADGSFSCMGLCAAGIQRCSDGNPGTCDGEVLPSAEPDGCSPTGTAAVDDDCDAMIDEDCPCSEGETRPCYAGPAGTAGTGRCMTGTLTCTGGAFGGCEGDVLPQAEACDNGGIDDDCNGTSDDLPGAGQPCDTGMAGVCADGVTMCVGPTLGCVGPTPAIVEACDMADDDCDGVVDDGFDFETSEEHCGGCNLPCGIGRTCCAGVCVSTDSDPAHCGECPTSCSGTANTCCRSGCHRSTDPECTGCAQNCADLGQTCCAGSCVDFMTDASNCGGCGASFACASGQRCCAGACVGEDDLHCGGCDPCAADAQCCGPMGLGACVPDDDPSNCRMCGVVCGMGQTCCDLGCSNVLADVRNCGACGNACAATQVCSTGLCCPTGSYNSGGICCPMGSANSGGICCASGLRNCGGTCVNTQTDEAHCGVCTTACSGLGICCRGSCQTLCL